TSDRHVDSGGARACGDIENALLKATIAPDGGEEQKAFRAMSGHYGSRDIAREEVPGLPLVLLIQGKRSSVTDDRSLEVDRSADNPLGKRISLLFQPVVSHHVVRDQDIRLGQHFAVDAMERDIDEQHIGLVLIDSFAFLLQPGIANRTKTPLEFRRILRCMPPISSLLIRFIYMILIGEEYG